MTSKKGIIIELPLEYIKFDPPNNFASYRRSIGFYENGDDQIKPNQYPYSTMIRLNPIYENCNKFSKHLLKLFREDKLNFENVVNYLKSKSDYNIFTSNQCFIKVVLLNNKDINFRNHKHLLFGLFPFLCYSWLNTDCFTSLIEIFLFLACAGSPEINLSTTDFSSSDIYQINNQYEYFKIYKQQYQSYIISNDLIAQIIRYMRSVPELLVNPDGTHVSINGISWLDGDIQDLGMEIWNNL